MQGLAPSPRPQIDAVGGATFRQPHNLARTKVCECRSFTVLSLLGACEAALHQPDSICWRWPVRLTRVADNPLSQAEVNSVYPGCLHPLRFTTVCK